MGDDEDENGDLAEGDDRRLPTYPRGMLKLEITDGERIMKALEYRRIDGLKLAETPLGFKVSYSILTIMRKLMDSLFFIKFVLFDQHVSPTRYDRANESHARPPKYQVSGL